MRSKAGEQQVAVERERRDKRAAELGADEAVVEVWTKRLQRVNQQAVTYCAIWEAIMLRLPPPPPVFVESRALDSAVQLRYKCADYRWHEVFQHKYEINASPDKDTAVTTQASASTICATDATTRSRSGRPTSSESRSGAR